MGHICVVSNVWLIPYFFRRITSNPTWIIVFKENEDSFVSQWGYEQPRRGGTVQQQRGGEAVVNAAVSPATHHADVPAAATGADRRQWRVQVGQQTAARRRPQPHAARDQLAHHSSRERGDEEVTWPAEPRNDDVVAQHGPDETKDEYLAGRGEEAPSSRPVEVFERREAGSDVIKLVIFRARFHNQLLQLDQDEKQHDDVITNQFNWWRHGEKQAVAWQQSGPRKNEHNQITAVSSR